MRFRRRVPLEVSVFARHTATSGPARVPACDPVTLVPPKPSRSSQSLDVRPARTWVNATLTRSEEAAEEDVLARLARLTGEHDDPLYAARLEFAPELLEGTP